MFLRLFMKDLTRTELRKLARAIRACRKALPGGPSQEAFSEQSDLHRTYYGAIERGEVNLSWESLSRVARGLKMKTSTLIARAGL